MLRLSIYHFKDKLNLLTFRLIFRWWFVPMTLILLVGYTHNAKREKERLESETATEKRLREMNRWPGTHLKTQRSPKVTSSVNAPATSLVAYHPQEKTVKPFLKVCQETNHKHGVITGKELRVIATQYEDAKEVVKRAYVVLDNGRRRTYWMQCNYGFMANRTATADEIIKRHLRLGTVSEPLAKAFRSAVQLETDVKTHPIMEYLSAMESLNVEAKIDAGSIGYGDLLAIEGSVRAACTLSRMVYRTDVCYQAILEEIPASELKACNEHVFAYYLRPEVVEGYQQRQQRKSKPSNVYADAKRYRETGKLHADPYLGQSEREVAVRYQWLSEGPDLLLELSLLELLKPEKVVDFKWPAYVDLPPSALLGSMWKPRSQEGK